MVLNAEGAPLARDARIKSAHDGVGRSRGKGSGLQNATPDPMYPESDPMYPEKAGRSFLPVMPGLDPGISGVRRTAGDAPRLSPRP